MTGPLEMVGDDAPLCADGVCEILETAIEDL